MSSTTYDGPSGFRYIIYLDKPFEVNNPQDISFFRSKNQFEEVGLIESIIKPKPEPKKDIDTLFYEELEKLKLNKKTIKIIKRAYISKVDFVADLEEGYKLDPTISKTDMNRLKFNFLTIPKPKKKRKK